MVIRRQIVSTWALSSNDTVSMAPSSNQVEASSCWCMLHNQLFSIFSSPVAATSWPGVCMLSDIRDASCFVSAMGDFVSRHGACHVEGCNER